MSERKIKTLQTTASSQTEAIGEAIGRRLRGGEVIELTSDLGGGKTTLVRGLARGAGSSNHVSSPTFTLSKVYQADNFQIHHFDFYRLQEAGIMRDELQELVNDPAVVLVVEWSDIVQSVLPADRLAVHLVAKSENQRRLECTYSHDLAYLMEDAA